MNFMRGFKKFWEKKNIILEDGQPGFERDLIRNEFGEVIGSTNLRLKIGDGVTPWVNLPYISGNSSSSDLYWEDI